MKFIADANIPKSIISGRSEKGIDIIDISTVIPANSPDREVFAAAIKTKRTIITRDKHFGNILLYPPETHYGVILVRTSGMSSPEILELLSVFMKSTSAESYKGQLFILENNKYRKRS